jgi:hypothetical protein
MRVPGKTLAQFFDGRAAEDLRHGFLLFQKFRSWSRYGGKLVQKRIDCC